MFIKRDNSKTIADVIERNTGIPIQKFLMDDELKPVKNIKEGVEFLEEFHKKHPNETIHIFGDYDADGITATRILYKACMMYGLNVDYRLPKRFSEGYGLSKKMVDEVNEGLIITVDNGITAIEPIKLAKSKGIPVIVIDHHLSIKNSQNEQILPCADIIIDPHIENESEFKDYCGAALAFLFAKELLPDKKLKQLLVLASIGTVVDVMPLIGSNRVLVKKGLEYINKGLMEPGLKVLVEKIGLYDHITSMDYGFKIGPVFNAPGRLYDNGAEKVMDMISLPRNDINLPFKADKLVKINERRKELVKEDMTIVETVMEEERPIVVYDDSLHEGIIGILAGNLKEQYQSPAIVFTNSSDSDIIKGSGRSISDVNLKNCLDKIQDYIYAYGGHPGAAGLSIRKEDFSKFVSEFSKAVGKLPEITDDIYYDLELDLNDIEAVMNVVLKGEPYGQGNPQPIFHTKIDFEKKDFKLVGDETHFIIATDNITLFGPGLAKKYDELGKPTSLEVVGTLSQRWNKNNVTNNLLLMDIEKA